MANSLGVPLSMDQVETQILTQRKDARGDRSARGGLGIMKDIAKKAVLRNKEYTTLYERLINDPFYAYTAARGDLTPSALEFIEKVARCIIPSFGRTKEMIQGSVAVPKYHARLTLVPPTEDVQEVDPKDVYVVHGGRFLEPEQFAALYGSLDKSNRYPVMGWSSVGDPVIALLRRRGDPRHRDPWTSHPAPCSCRCDAQAHSAAPGDRWPMARSSMEPVLLGKLGPILGLVVV